MAQTYKNIRVVFFCDNPESYTKVLRTIPNCETLIAWDNVKRYKVIKFESFIKQPKYHWNKYCNKLKSEVEDGYFFFLDDDDYLAHPNVLSDLVAYLTEEPDGLIVQFLRNGKPKPNNHLIATKQIRLGLIGGGCLVLHAKHKHVADWDGEQAADYRWIKAVSEKVKLKFVPLALQIAGNNGLHGKNPMSQQDFERQYLQSPNR